MVRYPDSVPAQQSLLAPLYSLTARVPACELWIQFLSSAEAVYDSLSTGALKNLANIASVMANVFDYLHDTIPQSVYSSQYLLNLSISTRQVVSSANLAAQLSTGDVNILLTQAAQNALATLQVWDPVQGYNVPNNPGQLATILMQGVSIGQ